MRHNITASGSQRKTICLILTACLMSKSGVTSLLNKWTQKMWIESQSSPTYKVPSARKYSLKNKMWMDFWSLQETSLLPGSFNWVKLQQKCLWIITQSYWTVGTQSTTIFLMNIKEKLRVILLFALGWLETEDRWMWWWYVCTLNQQLGESED